MASFKKKCKFCQKEIKLSDEIGNKWVPYDLDGNPHDCRTEAEAQAEAT
jgi:hypothetical protein